MSFAQNKNEMRGGRGLAMARAPWWSFAFRWWGAALMMALVACKPEMVVKPESLLVGAETVHPLEKNDLEQVRQRNAAVPASAVLVPLRAIVSGESGNKDSHALAVFTVAADKHAHKVAIEGQTLWRNDLVVTSGLVAGAEIVVQGAGELYDNAPVVARPAWTGRATTAD